MKKVGELIREGRESSGLLLREIADKLQVDVSFLSRIERGSKRPTKRQIHQLSQILKLSERELVLALLSDRLVSEILDEDLATEALKVAEQKIKYLKRTSKF